MNPFYVRLVVLLLLQVFILSCDVSSSLESDYEKFITLYQNGEYREADQVLQDLSHNYAGNHDVLMTNAIVSSNKGDHKRVVELLEEYQSSIDCDYQCRFSLAISYVNLGENLKAQQIFEGKESELYFTSLPEFSYKNYFPITVNSAIEFEADFWYGIDSIGKAYPLYIKLKNDMYNIDRNYNYIGSILLRASRFEDACQYFNGSCRLGNTQACKNVRKYCESY